MCVEPTTVIKGRYKLFLNYVFIKEGEMTMSKFVEMKHTDVRTVDRNELVDIATVKINPKDPVEKKMQDYVEQIKNPYCFLCNGYVVKLEFADNNKSIEDCVVDYMSTLI